MRECATEQAVKSDYHQYLHFHQFLRIMSACATMLVCPFECIRHFLCILKQALERLQHRCFPVNFAKKNLKKLFIQNSTRWTAPKKQKIYYMNIISYLYKDFHSSSKILKTSLFCEISQRIPNLQNNIFESSFSVLVAY